MIVADHPDGGHADSDHISALFEEADSRLPERTRPSFMVGVSRGIANAHHATEDMAGPPVDVDTMPFAPLEHLDLELPWDGLDPD